MSESLVNELFLVLGMAAVTFSVRYSLIAVSGRVKLSPGLTQALQYVPPAVLTAIIVPAVLFPEGQLWVSYENARLVIAIATVIIAVWRQNLLLTIVAGMALFLGYQGLLWILTETGTATVTFESAPFLKVFDP